MDAKALAKSKRAHSQHHSKKYHPNPKPKPPVDSGTANDAGIGKKPLGLGKQLKEKAHPTHSASALPSNWDRYEEEYDLGSEDPSPSGAGPNHTLDVVLPKSKGADYRHLIAEAQFRPQLNTHSDAFSSLDDVLPGDWNTGIGPLLSARGESILSRIGDDNFVVEDKFAAHNEVSFLSLNLHALAEQLEKIDLPQRLFIEADLFPPETQLALGPETASCSRSSEQMQATIDQETVQRMPEESSSSDFSEKVQVSDHDIEIPVYGFLDPTSPNLGSVSLGEAFIDPSEVSKSSYESKGAESETQFSVKSFEASSAEAELDMLLDSFSETNPNINEEASMAPIQIPTKLTFATNLDEELDDLINQTSIPINQSGSPQTHHDFQLPSSHPGPKSKQVDDFDSWLDTI